MTTLDNALALNQLFEKHGTDKSRNHYALPYARFFPDKQDEAVRLVEIGVRTGDSLRAWREYFPNGSIMGIDINPDCKAVEQPGISVFIGDQSDKKFLRHFCETQGPFDIIIDDGSHEPADQQVSFAAIWPHVNPGGLYVIEDIGCSQLARFSKKPHKKTTPEMIGGWMQSILLAARATATPEIYVFCNIAVIVKPSAWIWKETP